MTPYYEDAAVTLVHGDCFDVDVPVHDLHVVDAPYHAEVHAGHGTMERHGTSTPPAYDGADRREIDYSAWTDVDVRRYVERWEPQCRGWFVSVSSDELAVCSWKKWLREAGRLVFPLIPCIERGATVRMANDGPASWTTFAVVTRPRRKEFLSWGVTSSYYDGPSERKPVIGGKPLWLMEAFIRDYSMPGDLVADGCVGGGTTLAAAKRLERRGYGVEAMEEHCAIAAKRLASTKVQERMRFDAPEMKTQKGGLFG